MKSTDVKFWDVRRNRSSKTASYEVRWVVAGRQKSRTRRTKALAESFLSDLRQAAKRGEAFDTETGLPESMMKAKQAATWLAFVLAYLDAKWPHAAAKSRDGLTDSLATVTPALVTDRPGRPDNATLWRALRHFLLSPTDRDKERPTEIASAIRWLEQASLPVSALREARTVRAGLDALALRLDGKPAAAATVARKRAIFYNVLQYAVELEELDSNPIDRVRWKPMKVAEAVDPRVVINPGQAKELLAAVTYIGSRGGGRRLMAFYACMYYAALRPAEAVALRKQDCHLPEQGSGKLMLSGSRPEVNTRWTDSGSTHEQRQLKHRSRKDVRVVPIPPVLVGILRTHIAEFGTAEDGQLFQSERGKVVGSTSYGRVWADARNLGLSPELASSPVARRPYDLRHAAVSLWLNSGVPATEVARRAGHSVDVLLKVYAKCVDGQEEMVNRRIEEALGG
ncbi:tyrosine-type recombinase/integrase [Actinoallomurus purpureus]|uniref:tyrosine-type recombinase/integrase n=1 Tax=Actinoallomurus purpureus TaxID=478114 RepID=UPI002092968F|nr:tyrosine-type recombinase/integrase [Actinoallomurus purpureus]MCO6004498.1 tyrosine-type recombinase/integrase [Actinoallomurus purpureus]